MMESRRAIQAAVGCCQAAPESARRVQDVAGIESATKTAVERTRGVDALISSFGPPTLKDRGCASGAGGRRAGLFLGGDYQGAFSSLAENRFSGDLPLRLHVHLFRAASLFALYARSGGADASLRRGPRRKPGFANSSTRIRARLAGLLATLPGLLSGRRRGRHRYCAPRSTVTIARMILTFQVAGSPSKRATIRECRRIDRPSANEFPRIGRRQCVANARGDPLPRRALLRRGSQQQRHLARLSGESPASEAAGGAEVRQRVVHRPLRDQGRHPTRAIALPRKGPEAS